MAGNTSNIGFEKQIWDAACVLRGNIDASEYMEANDVQSQALSKVRDTLLPKLMSGEIDVSDIQL